MPDHALDPPLYVHGASVLDRTLTITVAENRVTTSPHKLHVTGPPTANLTTVEAAVLKKLVWSKRSIKTSGAITLTQFREFLNTYKCRQVSAGHHAIGLHNTVTIDSIEAISTHVVELAIRAADVAPLDRWGLIGRIRYTGEAAHLSDFITRLGKNALWTRTTINSAAHTRELVAQAIHTPKPSGFVLPAGLYTLAKVEGRVINTPNGDVPQVICEWRNPLGVYSFTLEGADPYAYAKRLTMILQSETIPRRTNQQIISDIFVHGLVVTGADVTPPAFNIKPLGHLFDITSHKDSTTQLQAGHVVPAKVPSFYHAMLPAKSHKTAGASIIASGAAMIGHKLQGLIIDDPLDVVPHPAGLTPDERELLARHRANKRKAIASPTLDVVTPGARLITLDDE